MTFYAIGDIHGQLGMLEDALALIEADGHPEADVVFLGDYVDRGPDSRGVIDRLARGVSLSASHGESGGVTRGAKWTCLLGNHDRMFLDYLTNGTVTNDNIKSGVPWTHRRLGGLTTMQSYGVDIAETRDPADILADMRAAVPEHHLAFLKSLPLYALRDPVLCVHAGIRPGVALEHQVENDLIWIREPFLLHEEPHPWLVVHGHTALDQAQHFGNRVDLDSGAGYGRPPSVAAIEGRDLFLLTPKGRVALNPE